MIANDSQNLLNMQIIESNLSYPNYKFHMRILLLCIPLVICINACKNESNSQTGDQRVESLLAQMSIEEKIGQMTQVTIDMILQNDKQDVIDERKLKAAILEKKVGSILNVKGQAYSREKWNEIITRIQDVATKESINGIPILYGIDAIHGSSYLSNSVLFPHNIGMAATRNTSLVSDAAAITAKETRSLGIPWNFAPVLDLGRQPLWSRFEETYGEDVFLVSTMGSAAIQGYEGESLSSADHVASTMKHFLGYSYPASGKDRTPAYIPNNMLQELYLVPFKKGVNAGASTIMINSGEVNGVPVHSSKFLLTTVLRDQLKFEGVVVSDWEDVIRLHTRHRVAPTPKEAVRMAIDAGIDMSMVPLDFTFYDLLLQLVKEGTISEARIDNSVRRILKLKFELGLFDNPYPVAQKVLLNNSRSTEDAALNAAQESLTLLKNEDNILPLKAKSKILLLGPAANNVTALHSSWSYTWQGNNDNAYPKSTLTIKDALVNKLGSENVISRSTRGFNDTENFQTDWIPAASKNVDYIVLCLGEEAYAEGPGVIDDLSLDLKQVQLAQASIATGKPVILVLAEGRPRIISMIEPGIKGILLAYRPSTMGANAITQVLTGDYNPNGLLPFSYPRNSGDILTYDHKFSEGIREDLPNIYGQGAFRPQWPFGHGLSYTQFEFSSMRTDKKSYSITDSIHISIVVKNIGERDGKTAIELYSQDLYSTISPSFRRLRDFKKISLNKGEERLVHFVLPVTDLAFVNETGEWVTEKGDFNFFIANQSVCIRVD